MKNNIKLRWRGAKGSVFSILAIVALVGGSFVSTGTVGTAFAVESPVTDPATGITLTDATLHGINGTFAADNTSFWWGPSSAGPFTSAVDPGPQVPSGWTYPPTGTGAQLANASFSYALTGLIPNTTYYFVAWSKVGGTWYPGAVLNFTTPPTASTVLVNNLQPDYTAIGGGGVYSAYYGYPHNPPVSPGTTAVYDGRVAGIIKAGQGIEPLPADWDEGLFAVKPTVTINAFAVGALNYDVETQFGVNPVWMTIEIDTGTPGDRSDNTVYQHVPTTNPAGWHTVDAGAGQWQQWTTPTSGITTGPLMTLSQVATAHTGLNVVRTYLRLGMGSSYYNGGTGTTAWVDKMTIGGVTYDFVAPPVATATINAQKIVCNDESDLPNWGAGGADITPTTASGWLAANPSNGCSLASDWSFEWKTQGDQLNPGGGTYGPAGVNWNTFTGIGTTATANVPIEQISLIQMREVLPTGYIPFTDTSSSTSAEFYCASDVGNYDNWEWIQNLQSNAVYNCVGFNVQAEDQVNLHAQKIVCDDESDLPNWGAGIDISITSNTASRWLAAHPENGCELADWNFQWVDNALDPLNPGDATGVAGGSWSTPFPGSVTIDASDMNKIWLREVADSDYIPFSGQNTTENVSAEIYCGPDVLNYDNWEFIDKPTEGGWANDYYCVAWNVPESQEPQACRVDVVSAVGDEGDGNGNAVAAWIHSGWTTALNSVAAWIWDTPEVIPANMLTDEDKTFTKDFYVDGPVNDATLNLAADNRYWITINGDDVISNTGEFNYGAVTGPTNVTSYVTSGLNTITLKVENIANGSTDPHTNPAAGIYQLVINGEAQTSCEQPPSDDDVSDVTVCKYQNSIDSQNLLDGWSVSLDGDEQDYSDVTGESPNGSQTGCVIFEDVPYGSYTLGEVLQGGWENLTGVHGGTDAGAQVAVNESTETFNLVNALVCSPNDNLMQNGSFEDPDVTDGSGWDIFAFGTSDLDWRVSWAGPYVGAPDIANAELHRGVNGWQANNGVQYTELDSDWNGHVLGGPEGEQASTILSQEISTVPGRTYQLSYAFSPRPGTAAADNSLEVSQDGNVISTIPGTDGSANTNTVWITSTTSFVAGDSSTDIAFKDLGTPNAEGTFLDDVRMSCVSPSTDNTGSITIVKEVEVVGDISGWNFEFSGDLGGFDLNNTTSSITFSGLAAGSHTVTELTNADDDWGLSLIWCDNGNEGYTTNKPSSSVTVFLGDDEDVTCTFTNAYNPDGGGSDDTGSISGMKWNDLEPNGVKDSGELGLQGWEILLGNATTGVVVSTVTDVDGNYSFFDIAPGTYSVCETRQDGWEKTYPSGNSVCQGGGAGHTVILSLGETEIGKDFGNHQNPTITTNGGGNTFSSGGGDGSNNLGRTDDNSVSGGTNGGSVLGDSTTVPGEVLGDQIALLPSGAPNTGGGGAAEGGLYGTLLMLTGLYGFIRSRKARI